MKTCCFLGHRKIDETEELKSQLKSIITNLIEDKNKGETYSMLPISYCDCQLVTFLTL